MRLVVDRAEPAEQAGRVGPGLVQQPRRGAIRPARRPSRAWHARRAPARAVAFIASVPGRPRSASQVVAATAAWPACCVPGLSVCGSAIQPASVLAACWAACRRRASARLATCVRSGARVRLRRACPAPCGTSRSGSSGTRCWPRCACASAGSRGRLRAARCSHARTAAGGSATTSKRHQRVLVAAELGALAAVDARLVGAEARACAVRPGIRSFLPCRLGTHRLWITSSALQRDHHRPADRDVDLVGGAEGLRRSAVDGSCTSHHHWCAGHLDV